MFKSIAKDDGFKILPALADEFNLNANYNDIESVVQSLIIVYSEYYGNTSISDDFENDMIRRIQRLIGYRNLDIHMIFYKAIRQFELNGGFD